jgi:glutamate synthase domain-containing protein 3
MTVPHTEQTSLVDASSLHYRELNRRLRGLVAAGARRVELRNVFGQRYIGTNLSHALRIDIFGTPGNDLGAFMDGPHITVHGNAQDGCGNTMNDGHIVVHGRAGDILALSARGGSIFVRDGVGCRAAIHMKEYEGRRPLVVVGDTAQDFAGEYMAGGVLVLLGLNLRKGEAHPARFVGTGMHGGIIYLRGSIEEHQLGREVGVAEPNEADLALLRELVTEFAAHFDRDAEQILAGPFLKLSPLSLRPYGRLYAQS